MSTFSPERVLNLLDNGQNDELRNYIKEAMIAQAVKSSGGQSAVKQRNAAKRIIKSAIKYSNNVGTHGAWIQDGKQMLCTGYVGIIFNEGYYIDGLETPPDGDYKIPDMNMILDKLAKPKQAYEVHLSQVKSAVAKWKTDGKPNSTCYFRVGESAYNAQFFIDMMEALGETQITIQQSNSVAPGYIETENARALICPIRINERTVTYGSEAA